MRARYDEGRGELADLLAVLEHSAPSGAGLPDSPIALAGFSFGAFVTSHAVAAVASSRALEQVVLVGTAASRFTVAPIAPELHDRTLVLHGEQDDTVPLADVMDWARPQNSARDGDSRRRPLLSWTIAPVAQRRGSPFARWRCCLAAFAGSRLT